MNHFFKQLLSARNIKRCFFFVILPALTFYVCSIFTMKKEGYGLLEILRDPAQQSGESSFLGFLSNIGVFLWVSSTALSLFFAFSKSILKSSKHRELFLLIGVLSFLLAMDDFFMIHDRYVNQKICYATYAACASLIFLRHFKTIVSLDSFAFFTAGTCLALSILADLMEEKTSFTYEQVQLVEEGFKFVGAATWLYFVLHSSSLCLAGQEKKG